MCRRASGSKRKRARSMPLGTTSIRGREPPAAQTVGDRGGDGDRGAAQPLAGQVERADPGGQFPPLHLRVAQGVFGGDDRADPGEPRGQPAVHAGTVEVGVDEVVAAGADDPDQAGQRGQVAVAGHAEVDDPDPVARQPVGHRPRVRQRHHLALDRQVPQQQPQLLLGPADAEPRDDVQCLHRSPSTGCRRNRCSRYFKCMRRKLSLCPMCRRGRAWSPFSEPGSIAQA